MICILSTSHVVFMKFRKGSQGKPAFKLHDVLECPNNSCFKIKNNDLGEIYDQLKE